MNNSIKRDAPYPSGLDMQNGTIAVKIDRTLQDLLPGYLGTRRKDVQKLRRAIAARDLETIRLLGHSMKGSGVGYGFERITDIGRQIKTAAKKQDLEELRKLTELLKKYLDCVTAVNN